jgi:hypothetical protein
VFDCVVAESAFGACGGLTLVLNCAYWLRELVSGHAEILLLCQNFRFVTVKSKSPYQYYTQNPRINITLEIPLSILRNIESGECAYS